MMKNSARTRLMKLALAAVTFAATMTAAIAVAKDPATPAAAAVSTAAPNTLSEREKAAGWRLLFDGKSVEQWRNYKKQDVSDKWKIQDGALVLTGKGGGDLVTKERFDSYELVLEYRISKGGNSGLMFHVQE